MTEASPPARVPRKHGAPKAIKAAKPGSRESLPFTPDEYNRVVARAELDQIVLLRCKYDVTDFLEKKDLRPLNKSIESAYKNIALSESRGIIAGEVQWSMQIPGEGKPKFKVMASFGISYTGVAGRNEMAAGAFFARVARFATYPYFRALVSHLSWSSGLHIPPLPIIREVKVSQSKKKG